MRRSHKKRGISPRTDRSNCSSCAFIKIRPGAVGTRDGLVCGRVPSSDCSTGLQLRLRKVVEFRNDGAGDRRTIGRDHFAGRPRCQAGQAERDGSRHARSGPTSIRATARRTATGWLRAPPAVRFSKSPGDVICSIVCPAQRQSGADKTPLHPASPGMPPNGAASDPGPLERPCVTSGIRSVSDRSSQSFKHLLEPFHSMMVMHSGRTGCGAQ